MAGRYFWSKDAFIYHDHPVQKGFSEDSLDEGYRFAYDPARQTHDKDLLVQRSALLGFPPPKVYTHAG
jgi:hypothetical protein